MKNKISIIAVMFVAVIIGLNITYSIENNKSDFIDNGDTWKLVYHGYTIEVDKTQYGATSDDNRKRIKVKVDGEYLPAYLDGGNYNIGDVFFSIPCVALMNHSVVEQTQVTIELYMRGDYDSQPFTCDVTYYNEDVLNKIKVLKNNPPEADPISILTFYPVPYNNNGKYISGIDTGIEGVSWRVENYKLTKPDITNKVLPKLSFDLVLRDRSGYEFFKKHYDLTVPEGQEEDYWKVLAARYINDLAHGDKLTDDQYRLAIEYHEKYDYLTTPDRVCRIEDNADADEPNSYYESLKYGFDANDLELDKIPQKYYIKLYKAAKRLGVPFTVKVDEARLPNPKDSDFKDLEKSFNKRYEEDMDADELVWITSDDSAIIYQAYSDYSYAQNTVTYISGYQLKVSKYKNFRKSKYTKSKRFSHKKCNFNRIFKGKIKGYYYKVRPYRKIDGKYYYGAWQNTYRVTN